MSLKGLGIDIVETRRFALSEKGSKDHFLRKNYSEKELDYCFSFKASEQHLAGMFAAKEAVFKALGRKISLKSIEIERKDSGQPIVFVNGKRVKSIHVSLSHTSETAIAIAVRN